MKKTLLLFALLSLSLGLYAQKITGRVTGADDKLGIPGATVLIKGTTSLAVTGADGSYSINAEEGKTLVFSFMGYIPQEIVVGKSNSINVELRPDAAILDEVVVVGFGTQRRVNLTGAVANIDVKQALESRPITDVGRALQGSTPGLTVYTTSGSLGATPTIKIRGITGTLSGGSSDPLILVDNVEVPDLSFVNPDDIESISTLKDATSAIYGARAAFGVLLITTKKGSSDGKSSVTYSNNFAFATPTKRPQLSRADLNLDYSFKQLRGLGSTTTEFGYTGFYYNEQTIARVKDYIDKYGYGDQFGREMVEGRDFDYRPGGGAYFYRPWDVDAIYYKKWAPQQTHNVSVAGGTDKINYNITGGFLNQRGILNLFEDSYKRYNVNLFVGSKINNWLTVRGRTMLTKVDADLLPFSFTGSTYDALYYLYRWHPTYPYGTYNGNEFRNPVNEMKSGKPMEYGYYYNRYTLGSTLNLAEGLTFDFDYTYGTVFETQHISGGIVTGINHWDLAAGQTFNDVVTSYVGPNGSYDYAQYSTNRTTRNTYNGYATYVKDIDAHSFKFVGGFNIEDWEVVNHSSRRNALYDYNKGEPNLAGGDQIITSAHDLRAVAGFFGRINYVFKNRYLFEVNARYDGSSNFPLSQRFGFFPSASVGYRLMEEPFMEFARPYVNEFKPRVSYGAIGNEAVGGSLFVPTISPYNSGWLVNSQYVGQAGSTTLAAVPRLVSSDLTWETVSTLDVGLDASFLRGKIALTFDWYQRRTSDMLTPGVTVPSALGASAAYRNFGELTTTGVELQVDFRHTFENGFRINLLAQFSDFTTKITKWPTTSASLLSGNYEGKTIGEIWGYETDRLFQKSDFQYDANGNIIQIKLPNGQTKNLMGDGIPTQYLLESGSFLFSPGDVKYIDRNHNGVIDYGDNTIGNPGDRKVIGNSQPRFSYGFRIGAAWKGFDFDMFFQGVGSRQIWATGNTILPGWLGTEANFSHTLDYWTSENTGAFYPRPLNYGNSGSIWNYQAQTRYILNAAYLRCKILALGYTVPNKHLARFGIKNLRVYFSGENLFEFDKMGDIPIDPEIDWTTQTSNDARSFGRSYPYRRTVSFGLQVTI